MVVALSCRMADPSAHHPYDALREPVFVRRKRDFAVPALGGERRESRSIWLTIWNGLTTSES
ncbi:hypothetical protein JQ625_16655 [Bradyrhizobium diazoefficiens]|nr:hypothetical protein [Bradyrhizobium diazoefficiens]MBR0776471.1 hypothetical protein [Bradyrhizobium diazoefficiens]